MTSTKTERIPNEFVGQGAVRQNGGSLPLYRCNGCGEEVVWVKSGRTGAHYLVNVRTGYMGQRFYQGNDVHPRNCAELQAEKLDASKRREQFSQAMAGWQAEIKRLKDTGAPQSEILNAIEEMGQELEELKP
jgi:hypothetical protein